MKQEKKLQSAAEDNLDGDQSQEQAELNSDRSFEPVGLDNFTVHPIDFNFHQVTEHRKIYEKSTDQTKIEKNVQTWRKSIDKLERKIALEALKKA